MKSILSIIIFSVLFVSGHAQTRNVLVGTNNAVVQPTNFWSADASNARTGLGLGSAATNPSTAFQPSSLALSNLAANNAANLTNFPSELLRTNGVATSLTNFPTYLLRTNGSAAGLTNIPAANIVGVVALASNVLGPAITASNILGTIAISNGGTGATNAAEARTNLGLSPISSVAFFDVSLGGTNAKVSASGAGGVALGWGGGSSYVTADSNGLSLNVANLGLAFGVANTNGAFITRSNLGFSVNLNSFWTATNAETARTNLNLGAPWLTNTNSSNFRTDIGLGSSWLTNTNNPVFVNTNGEVVSPTNFWQAAPIVQTLVQTFTPSTNTTNAASNSRFLHIYSMASNITGITNTITLPTNILSFNGDEVTVTHRGPTNSTTVVRQLGAATNLISLNAYDESVKFIKYGNWEFYQNVAFVEPITFANTNASENAAISRNNIGFSTNLNSLWTSTNTNLTKLASDDGSSLTNIQASNVVGLSTNTNTAVIWAYQTDDVTNSTTNFVSTSLSFTAAANTKYAVDMLLLVNGTDTYVRGKLLTSNDPVLKGYWFINEMDLNTNLTRYTGAISNIGGIAYLFDSATTNSLPAASPQKFVVIGPTSTNAVVTFQFDYTTGSDAVIEAGSYLRAEVIEE